MASDGLQIFQCESTGELAVNWLAVAVTRMVVAYGHVSPALPI